MISQRAPVNRVAPVAKAAVKGTHYNDMFLKPAVVGAVAVGGSKLLWPQGVFKLRGMDVPLWAVVFGTAYVGGVAAEILHQYAFPEIPNAKKLSAPISAGVAAGANTGAMAASLYLANPISIEQIGLPAILAVGAGSQILGEYLWDKFIDPMLFQ